MHGEEKQLDARVGAGLRADLTVWPHALQGLGTACSSSISRLYYALVPAITIASDAHARQLLSMWPLPMHLDGWWHDVGAAKWLAHAGEPESMMVVACSCSKLAAISSRESSRKTGRGREGRMCGVREFERGCNIHPSIRPCVHPSIAMHKHVRVHTQQSERACCRRTGATQREINCQREEGANE